jgi:hypothetical protein
MIHIIYGRSLVDNPRTPQLLFLTTTTVWKAGKKDRIEVFA